MQVKQIQLKSTEICLKLMYSYSFSTSSKTYFYVNFQTLILSFLHHRIILYSILEFMSYIWCTEHTIYERDKKRSLSVTLYQLRSQELYNLLVTSYTLAALATLEALAMLACS